MSDFAVRFQDVTKKYKLYFNERHRLLSLLRDNRRHYKIKLANHRISFDIKAGESVAVLGRNGAGKSTLVKIITGVVFPTSGKVTVKGRVSALLELTAGFDLEFTGRENIHLKASLLGLSRQQIKAIEDDIIEFAELDEYIDQPVRTYSSGMRARLGFAIHSHTNPDILVVDEALSVGDAKFQEKCRAKAKEIVERDHVTVLLVTHSMAAAKSFCDRGLVLHKGRLVADAPIAEAIQAYKEIIK